MLLQEYLETFFGKCESPLKGKKVILNIYDRVFNCFKIILRWSISFTSFIEIHINIIRIENRKNNYPFFNYLLFYIWFCCIFIYCFPWTIYSDYYKYSYGILRKYMHKRKTAWGADRTLLSFCPERHLTQITQVSTIK